MSEVARNEITISPMDLIEHVNQQEMSKKVQAIDNFQKLVQSQLANKHDYGVIPGTQKPTLLKPGAEKILMLMGLTSDYDIVDQVLDYDNGFFSYTVKCTLTQGTQRITEGLGSANTKENRYQLKTWNKKENKKMWDGVTYQDPYTLNNTVLKMAKKRAQIDATLTVASLSNVFTQDLEDLGSTMDNGYSRQQSNSGEQSSGRPEDFTMTSGKHKGESLGQLVNTDREYVEWAGSDKNTYNSRLRQAAREVLAGQQTAKSQATAPVSSQSSPFDGDRIDIPNEQLPF
ncbi:hypothetical protein ACRYI5_00970 [Furfurilactobacillus sp. WILCCON 0119]